MISVIIVSLLLYCVSGSGLKISPSLFEEFKAKYRKSYNSVVEEKRRLGIFMSKMAKVAEMNRANPYAEFGINKFADLTEEELMGITYLTREKYHKANHGSSRKSLNKDVITYTPEEVTSSCASIDWRKKGAVTAVRDEGDCPGCWAFSAVGNIEGQWFIAGHPLVSLSVQELLSCGTTHCSIGSKNEAFKWLINNRSGQIVTEASLPFVNNINPPSCPLNLDNLTVGAVIKHWHELAHDEGQMATFLCKNGPLSVLVDARSWESYKSGIVTEGISSNPFYNALIVGLDKNNHPPYWIIKNSWGSDWGEDGYIRVAYGTNLFLITYNPSTSVVGDAPFSTTTPFGAGFLVQKQCKDTTCSESCSNSTYPLNKCFTTEYDKAQFITCTDLSIIINNYEEDKCTGTFYPSEMPRDQCLSLSSDTSIENLCVHASHYSTPLESKIFPKLMIN